MEAFRASFVLLFVFGFFCTTNSNPITGLFGKSDDKAEADEKTDEKATVTTTTTAKTAGDATTTTTAASETSSSSCGGLKGFLHICEKTEPTEPPKSVKVRSVPEEEDDDSDSDDDSDEDSEEKEPQQETSSAASEPSEGVAKRQVEDSETAPILGEVPPMVGDAMAPPVEPSEGDEGKVDKRQTEDSDRNEDDTDTDEVMEVVEGSRRRRECRDGDGEEWKNCRKRREFVPSCTGKNCREETTERQ